MNLNLTLTIEILRDPQAMEALRSLILLCPSQATQATQAPAMAMGGNGPWVATYKARSGQKRFAASRAELDALNAQRATDGLGAIGRDEANEQIAQLRCVAKGWDMIEGADVASDDTSDASESLDLSVCPVD